MRARANTPPDMGGMRRNASAGYTSIPAASKAFRRVYLKPRLKAKPIAGKKK